MTSDKATTERYIGIGQDNPYALLILAVFVLTKIGGRHFFAHPAYLCLAVGAMGAVCFGRLAYLWKKRGRIAWIYPAAFAVCTIFYISSFFAAQEK